MSNFMYTANGSAVSNKQRIIESMGDVDPKPAPKLPSDFFNLAGNLKLAGSVRATNFFKEDGTELSSVIKMGLPENVYYVDKKLGINQDKPMADFDVKGKARVVGELGVDGSMGVSGNFASRGSGLFAGKVVAEDDLAVMKNGGFGGYLNVGGNLNTQGTGTFKGVVTAEDDLVANKNAGIRGNLGVSGNFETQGNSIFKGPVTAESTVNAKNIYAKGNIIIDNSTEQDKLKIFQNGDSKPPFLFYNKSGRLGLWDGQKSSWVLDSNGNLISQGDLIASKNASIGGNLGVGGSATFRGPVTAESDINARKVYTKGNVRIDDSTEQDKLMVFQNGDSKPPYLFYNKQGYMGVWDGQKAPWTLDGNGNFNTQGDINFNGANKWIIHTPDDNRRIMYMAPGNEKGEWMWDKTTQFYNNGNVQLSGGLMLGDQNIPHPDVGDGAFYRADGQVQIATDDLIRLRHVGSKSTGIQFDSRPGTGDIQNPNGQMKLSRQGIMFGGPNADRDVNSAQITAGLHIPDSLNIVGMSNKEKGNRRVDMLAEGGFNVNGPTNINGSSTVSGNIVGNAGRLTLQNDGDWKDINLQGKCGQWHMSGPRCTEGADFGIWYNPEPWSDKWQEQIRLSAKEGKVKFPANSQICIGDVCLKQADGRLVIDKPVTIQTGNTHGGLNIQKTANDGNNWNYIQFINHAGQRTTWSGSGPDGKFGSG